MPHHAVMPPFPLSDMMTLCLTCGITGKDMTKSECNRRAVGITDGSCKMMALHQFQIIFAGKKNDIERVK